MDAGQVLATVLQALPTEEVMRLAQQHAAQQVDPLAADTEQELIPAEEGPDGCAPPAPPPSCVMARAKVQAMPAVPKPRPPPPVPPAAAETTLVQALAALDARMEEKMQSFMENRHR